MRASVTAILLAVGLTACRQDMHNQQRYKPLAAAAFFGDGRSARPEIDGTVARGHLRLDEARYTGKSGQTEVADFPFRMTRADLERGRERFEIFCTPCHGRVGDGQGLVVERGLKAPPSYMTDRLMKAPPGHFFNVATNGFGAMPSYASRVPVDDRWRIVAYIKVLQFSQSAGVNDIPAAERGELDKTARQQLEEHPVESQSEQRPPVPAPARRGFDAPSKKGSK